MGVHYKGMIIRGHLRTLVCFDGNADLKIVVGETALIPLRG